LTLTNGVCTPCHCDDATLQRLLLGFFPGARSVDVHFEHHAFEDNTFSGTVHNQPPAGDVGFGGTWEKDGDTITFTPKPQAGGAAVAGGGLTGKFTLSCEKNEQGQNVIVLKKGTLTLKYDCRD